MMDGYEIEWRKRNVVIVRDDSGCVSIIDSIASPLKTHRSRTIYACREHKYPDTEDITNEGSSMLESQQNIPKKQVVYYKLDLGLNHYGKTCTNNSEFSSYSTPWCGYH